MGNFKNWQTAQFSFLSLFCFFNRDLRSRETALFLSLSLNYNSCETIKRWKSKRAEREEGEKQELWLARHCECEKPLLGLWGLFDLRLLCRQLLQLSPKTHTRSRLPLLLAFAFAFEWAFFLGLFFFFFFFFTETRKKLVYGIFWISLSLFPMFVHDTSLSLCLWSDRVKWRCHCSKTPSF